jgi:uncharacterized protein (DUF4415 family)
MPSSSRNRAKKSSASSVSAKRRRKSAKSFLQRGGNEDSVAFDADNLPMTPEMIRRLRPISKETLDFINRARGRPPVESPKQAVSLRLDQDVIAHFKDQGPGWQGRINAALRKQAKLGSKK